MNGILNILKPPGMTSFDVVSYLRRALNEKKIGHTGTLDPGVAGVLPICLGGATKVIEYLTDKDKIYRAELLLGISTDTQDSTGNVIGSCSSLPKEDDIRNTVLSFAGKSEQIPPMYSAVKIGGKKLYELAREGITVDRKAREIEIYSIDIIKIESVPVTWSKLPGVSVIFDVHCSKGTYIRTLCSDIGDMLGCGGHMAYLLRLKAGAFPLSEAVTLEQLQEDIINGTVNERLISVERVFEALDLIRLNKEEDKKFFNGIMLKADTSRHKEGQYVRIYDYSGKFAALGEFVRKEGELYLKSRKQFINLTI